MGSIKSSKYKVTGLIYLVKFSKGEWKTDFHRYNFNVSNQIDIPGTFILKANSEQMYSRWLWQSDDFFTDVTILSVWFSHKIFYCEILRDFIPGNLRQCPVTETWKDLFKMAKHPRTCSHSRRPAQDLYIMCDKQVFVKWIRVNTGYFQKCSPQILKSTFFFLNKNCNTFLRSRKWRETNLLIFSFLFHFLYISLWLFPVFWSLSPLCLLLSWFPSLFTKFAF